MPELSDQVAPTAEPTVAMPVQSAGLPRRDWFLLPAISLATILFIFGGTEIVTRILYPAKEYDECRVPGETDPRRAKANCTVRAKGAETPWVTYAMNECGFRTFDSCGAKPPNVLRLTLLGASLTMAKNVPLEQSWGQLTAAALAKASGRKVQVENMGWELISPINCYRELNQVISMHSDLAVYPVNQFDLARGINAEQLAHRDDPALPRLPEEHSNHIQVEAAIAHVKDVVNDSRTVLMSEHFLFSNPQTYLHFVVADGHRADYMRHPLPGDWDTIFTRFGVVIDAMGSKLRAARIPLVVIALPSRVQVILAKQGGRSGNLDAYLMERRIGEICRKAGVIYLPTLDAFAHDPQWDDTFYVVDQHISVAGDAIIARELSKKLLDGSIPAFGR